MVVVIRAPGALAVAVLLVAGAGFVSWSPTVEAGCHQRFPACLCRDLAIEADCSSPPWVEMANVNVKGYVEQTDETSGSYVVFEFSWATEEPEPAVDFHLALASDSATWPDGDDVRYTHSNMTGASVVKVFQRFDYVGDIADVQIQFNLTANGGTAEAESASGTLAYDGGQDEAEPTGEGVGVIEIAVVSGIVGALLGALLAALAILIFRK